MDIELLGLQTEYLNYLPDKLDLIYELLLNIEKEENEAESINNLKGIIHSIKGSSGSYEINFISELCHNFEDNIELLDKGQDKKNVLINCFHYYELIREFLDSYSPGGEQDLTPLYDKLKGLGLESSFKKETVSVSHLNEILVCTDDNFYRDAVLLSLTREDVNFSYTKNFKSYKKGAKIDVIFLVSPQKDEFENFPKDISVISLIQESEIKSLPKNFPFVLITHHLVKDIRNEYFKVLKNIKKKEVDKPEKVLFVDDDESIHPLVKMAFKAHKDIEMVYCHSAREAQDTLENFIPDFIILDSMMPEISGKDFKKILSENEKFKDIPVVFLTGLDSKKEINALKELGAIDVILKPFKIKELAEQVLKVWSKV